MDKVELAILTIYLIVAADVLGITLIIPVFATYATHLGAPAALAGLQFTVFSGAAIIASLYLGRLSDRFGRRIVFLYSGCGACLSFTGSAFAQNFTMFLITSAFGGLFTGTVGNAYAYVSDILPPEVKTKYLGNVTAVISACFVIGPFIGGSLALYSLQAPFMAAASIAFLEIFFVYFFITEPRALRLHSVEYFKASIEQHRAAMTVQRQLEPRDGSNSSSGSNVVKGRYDETRKVLQRTFSLQSDSSDDENEESDGSVGRLSIQLRREVALALDAEGTMTSEVDAKDKSTAKNIKNDIKQKERGLSPWLNASALLVGGCGTFLNVCTFTGMTALVPFVLMNPSYGLSDTSKKQNHSGDRKVSLAVGLLLGFYGVILVLSMINIYPRVRKQIGFTLTGAIGSLLFGGAFCCIILTRRLWMLFSLYVVLAIGNSLCRPMFPAFLAAVATKGRNAEYMAISSTFSNLAIMTASELTVVYNSINPLAALLIAGCCSLLNSVILLIYSILWNAPTKENKAISSDSENNSVQTATSKCDTIVQQMNPLTQD